MKVREDALCSPNEARLARQKGYQAFIDGETECTEYPPANGSSDHRKYWWMGWYDAKIEQNVGHTLEKHGSRWRDLE